MTDDGADKSAKAFGALAGTAVRCSASGMAFKPNSHPVTRSCNFTAAGVTVISLGALRDKA